MSKCNKPVRENPFYSYRDPQTGRWVVILNAKNDLLNAKNDLPRQKIA